MLKLLVLVGLVVLGSTETVDIKIVDQLSSYGFNAFAGNTENDLVAKIKPLNFSGPPHLRLLNGRCFNFTKGEYRYRLCPFRNITQHEVSFRWNPYNGILGVWNGWNIESNLFKTMKYEKGDNCGSTERNVRLQLICGQANNVTSVSEPSTCNYEMKFETPYVCHEDAMLVYPRMKQEAREAWDALEEERHNGLLTEKGYNFTLSKLYLEAGFISELPYKLKTKPSQSKTKVPEFSDLNVCNVAYAKIMEEMEKLRNNE